MADIYDYIIVGASSAGCVLAERLGADGVNGLRVADCSVIPGHVTGNTNAPAMAIGLRAAAMILTDRRRSDVCHPDLLPSRQPRPA